VTLNQRFNEVIRFFMLQNDIKIYDIMSVSERAYNISAGQFGKEYEYGFY